MQLSLLQFVFIGEFFLVALCGLLCLVFISTGRSHKLTKQLEASDEKIARLTADVSDAKRRAQKQDGDFGTQRLVLEKEINNYRAQVEKLQKFQRLYLEIDSKSRTITNRAIELVNTLLSSALESDWDKVAEIGVTLEEELRSINPFLEELEFPEGDYDLESIRGDRGNDTDELRDLMQEQVGLIASLQNSIKEKKLTTRKANDGLSDVERLMVESGRMIEMLGSELGEAKAELESLRAAAEAEETNEDDIEVEFGQDEESPGDGYSGILENRIKALEDKNSEANNTIAQLEDEKQKLLHKIELLKSSQRNGEAA